MNLFYAILWCISTMYPTIQANINLQYQPSKNFDERKVKKLTVTPQYIILHYTANCDKKSVLSWFKNALNPTSAHYVIGPNGQITQTVDPDKRAWHAGDSSWKNNTDMNAYSIGIEIVNPGFTQQKTDPCPQTDDDPWNKNSSLQVSGSELHWYPFTKAQIQSLIALCQQLMLRYQIPPENILGHSDIAPHRKSDPGPLLPWKFLAEHNVGIWPKSLTQHSNHSVQEIQTMLQAFGYKIKITGTLDKETMQVLKAFQMHFRPTNIDGNADPQTIAILYALLNMN